MHKGSQGVAHRVEALGDGRRVKRRVQPAIYSQEYKLHRGVHDAALRCMDSDVVCCRQHTLTRISIGVSVCPSFSVRSTRKTHTHTYKSVYAFAKCNAVHFNTPLPRRSVKGLTVVGHILWGASTERVPWSRENV